jgi:hypothetical protein
VTSGWDYHRGLFDGISKMIASILEQCSLLLPLLRGAGPIALMLFLDGMMMTV